MNPLYKLLQRTNAVVAVLNLVLALVYLQEQLAIWSVYNSVFAGLIIPFMQKLLDRVNANLEKDLK